MVYVVVDKVARGIAAKIHQLLANSRSNTSDTFLVCNMYLEYILYNVFSPIDDWEEYNI